MREPVLLLHGQPGRAGDWDPVRAALGSAVHALAVDRPGWNGRSPATDLAGNAAAALRALDSLGAARVVVVGHSLGGAVAAWLAAAYPERVSALVLVAPSANVASLYAFDRWLTVPVLGAAASAVAFAGLGLALSVGAVRRWAAAVWRLDERYLGSVRRMLLSRSSWRAFVTEQRALVRGLPVLESRLAEISAPTRIVVGSRDRVVPLGSARALASQIPGASLVVLEGAGHLLAQQQAERLAEVIGEMAGVPVGRAHG